MHAWRAAAARGAMAAGHAACQMREMSFRLTGQGCGVSSTSPCSLQLQSVRVHKGLCLPKPEPEPKSYPGAGQTMAAALQCSMYTCMSTLLPQKLQPQEASGGGAHDGGGVAVHHVDMREHPMTYNL